MKSKKETESTQTNTEITETERKSVFNKFTTENVNPEVDTVKTTSENLKEKVDEQKVAEKTQIFAAEQTQSQNDLSTENTNLSEPQLLDTDAITDTQATLPKIFNENAAPEIQAEFQAPIEINETETTMIRRRSLMGESRLKAEEGYDDTHVRLAWQPLKQEEEKTEEEKLETILEGATVYPTLPSRAAAHWWSLFLGILLLPISWFFINDGIEKLETNNTLLTINFATLEVAGATLAILVFLFATQFSSLGAFIMGVVTTIIGGIFLFLPQQSHNFFDPIVGRASHMGKIVDKIFTYFSANAHNGTLFYFGLILIAIGFIAHTARRQGRREQQIRNDLGLVGIDDKIAKKARKAALKAEKAEMKAEAKAKAKIERKK